MLIDEAENSSEYFCKQEFLPVGAGNLFVQENGHLSKGEKLFRFILAIKAKEKKPFGSWRRSQYFFFLLTSRGNFR